MKKTFFVISLCISLASFGQQQAGKKNVESLCGCFDVEFKYAETFSPDPNYKYHDRETISGGTEYIFPVVNTDKRLVLQHLLVVTDSIIVKHWREEWTYENPVLYNFKGDKTWVKEQLKPEQVKGKWTQTVWEVSDAPRYQGFGDWVNIEGKPTWQNTAFAPLPRREYSVRSDYNILKRQNRIIIDTDGWIHDQNNQKIIRATDGTDKLLTEEKGLNTYKKINESACQAAKDYWEKNKVYWTKVRTAWEDYIKTHAVIKLKEDAGGKPMHDLLFAIAKDFADKKITDVQVDEKIKATFDKYLSEEKTAAVK
ncbi:DUF6607 family protein [Ferruginibacter sp.]